MTWPAVILVAALTFLVCFLADKGFSKLFRGKKQHASGLSVRLDRAYGAGGLVVMVLGVAALLTWQSWLLIVGGIILMATGAVLLGYYLTFGVYYDQDTFLLTTFGKKDTVYRFADIRSQRLYTAAGGTIIELYLTDGRVLQLQSRMKGVYPFLDAAFDGWLRQTGRKKEDCPFYDPDNSCWFPKEEA